MDELFGTTSATDFNDAYDRAKLLFLLLIDCKDETTLPETVLIRIEKAASKYALSVIHIRRVLEREGQK